MGNVLRPKRLIIELLYNMLFAKKIIYIYIYILCVHLKTVYVQEVSNVYSSTQNPRRSLTCCFKGVQH